MKLEEAKAIVTALVTLRESATDEQALAAPALYPAWRPNIEYKTGVRLLHDDILYKVLQDHISQADWTPDAAPSLFAKVLISDPETTPEWEQSDSTNPYMKGDKVTHDGFVWESCIDYNTHEPTEQNEILGIWAKV